MDNQMLEMLKQILEGQKRVELEQQENTVILRSHTEILKLLDKRVSKMEKTLDITHEEVARTRENMTEARADLRLVKIATVENSKDIEKLKLIK